MRSARWPLPEGIAALAARAKHGPVLLVDLELSGDEVLAAGAMALGRFSDLEQLVVIRKDDVRSAIRELDRVVAERKKVS